MKCDECGTELIVVNKAGEFEDNILVPAKLLCPKCGLEHDPHYTTGTKSLYQYREEMGNTKRLAYKKDKTGSRRMLDPFKNKKKKMTHYKAGLIEFICYKIKKENIGSDKEVGKGYYAQPFQRKLSELPLPKIEKYMKDLYAMDTRFEALESERDTLTPAIYGKRYSVLKVQKKKLDREIVMEVIAYEKP